MITASINARMGSTRLPGKALMDVNGKPMLSLLLKRLRKAEKLDKIVLATTHRLEDDILCEWAKKERIPFHRGPEKDVLSRTVDAHKIEGSSIVVRVCGDTPLIEPRLIDLAVDAIETGQYDIAMSGKDRTYPHGVSAHAVRMRDLEALDRTTDDPVLREHVTLHFYERGGFRGFNLVGRPEWEMPGQRLQVDYEEDLEGGRMINDRLGDDCSLGEIVSLLRREPWIRGFNCKCAEKPIR